MKNFSLFIKFKNEPVYSNWKQNEIIRPVIFGYYWICITLLFIFGITLLINPVSATINISVEKTGTDFIFWQWDNNLIISEINIDGLPVNVINTSINKYILSPVLSNSTHFINLKTLTDSGYNITTTLPKEVNNINKLSGFLFGLIYLLIALVILFFASRLPILGIIAMLFCFIGIIKGLVDTSFLSFLLYIVTLIICIYVTGERVKN